MFRKLHVERFISTASRQIRDGWAPMTAAIVVSHALSGSRAAALLVIAAVAAIAWLLLKGR